MVDNLPFDLVTSFTIASLCMHMVGRTDKHFVSIYALFHFRLRGVAVAVGTDVWKTVHCSLELVLPGGRGAARKVWSDGIAVVVSTHGSLLTDCLK